MGHLSPREHCNGAGMLNEDLWLKIFRRMDVLDIATHCSPVCRAWRAWALEPTSEFVWFSHQYGPSSFQKPEDQFRNFASDVPSLTAFIASRSRLMQNCVLQYEDMEEELLYKFVAALGTCKRLERFRLCLGNPQPDWILADLGKLSISLKDLSLKGPVILAASSRPDFPNFPNLERLSLSYPDGCWVLMSQVKRFAKLRYLRLKNCLWPSSLQHLDEAKNLEVLRLEPMPRVDAALYQCVQCMPKLQLLRLQGINEIREMTCLSQILALQPLRKVELGVMKACEKVVQAILAHPKIYKLNIDTISDRKLDLSSVQWRQSELTFLGLHDEATAITGVNLSDIFLMPKMNFLCMEASTIGYANLYEIKTDTTRGRNLELRFSQFENAFNDVVKQHLVNFGFRVSSVEGDPRWFILCFGDGDGSDLELDEVIRGQSIDAELKNLGLKSLQ